MTKCGNRSDPQYRAILGVLKQAASSLSLGNLPVQMTLRQRRRIPYLTSPNWFEAVQYLGSTWEGETRDGLDVAGTYSESWMNLFMNFGAHNILTSRFVQSLPVDEYDVPQDIVNPFAVQLTVIAKLVGIIGCDGLEYVDDMPVFTGTRTRLEFRRDGHKAWIGRFTQEPGLSTYMFGNWMTVGKASIHAGGCVLYRLGIVIPLLETQAMEQPPHALIRDLQLKGPSETPFVSWRNTHHQSGVPDEGLQSPGSHTRTVNLVCVLEQPWASGSLTPYGVFRPYFGPHLSRLD